MVAGFAGRIDVSSVDEWLYGCAVIHADRDTHVHANTSANIHTAAADTHANGDRSALFC